jgi:hypothetical protein
MTAKSAPYPPCTVTAFWPTGTDLWRCCRRVTQPPHIAGPLGVRVCARQKVSIIKFRLDIKTSGKLSGLRHLDNLIVT